MSGTGGGNTFTIGVRRAENGDAASITSVHDASWRYAYDGIIPAMKRGDVLRSVVML